METILIQSIFLNQGILSNTEGDQSRSGEKNLKSCNNTKLQEGRWSFHRCHVDKNNNI